MKIKILLMLFLLSGCATMGNTIDMNKVANIREGSTTKQEVIDLLGSPSIETLNGDGKELLTYASTRYKTKASSFVPVVGIFSGGADMSQQAVQILIGIDGKVEKLISTNSKNEVRTGLLN